MSIAMVFWVVLTSAYRGAPLWAQGAFFALCGLPLGAIPLASHIRRRWACDPRRAEGYVGLSTVALGMLTCVLLVALHFWWRNRVWMLLDGSGM